MGLFRFERNKVLLTKELVEIKEFREIDKREDADRLFAYIYHSCDWDSPYSNTPEEQKRQTLKEDFLDGEEPDEVVKRAIQKYRKLQMTPSMELLEAARKAARALKNYFEEIDPTMSENPGREAKDLMSNLSKVGDVLNKFEEWENILKKEQDRADTRRGVKRTKYNQ